jgi:hypothetical protein
MFTIKSTQLMEWPGFGFTLHRGDNVLPSRKAVPPKLWPKLERFRALKLLDFEGAPNADKAEDTKLADLTQQQLYAMPFPELLALAKTSGIAAKNPSKKALLDELVKKAKPLPVAEHVEKAPGDHAHATGVDFPHHLTDPVSTSVAVKT